VLRAAAYLVLYNIGMVLRVRREFVLTPLAASVTSVTLIPYGLAKFVGDGDVGVVVSTGLVLGSVLMPSIVAAFYTVLEVTLGTFEKYMALPVPRSMVILARVAAISLINLAPITVSLVIAALLHGVPVTAPFLAALYLLSTVLTMGVTGVTLLFAGGSASLEKASLTISILSIVLADLSPILFPLSSLPPTLQAVLLVNPASSVIEAARSAILWGRLDAGMTVLSLAVNLAWFAVGLAAVGYRLRRL